MVVHSGAFVAVDALELEPPAVAAEVWGTACVFISELWRGVRKLLGSPDGAAAEICSGADKEDSCGSNGQTEEAAAICPLMAGGGDHAGWSDPPQANRGGGRK
jgi:hypothetical protein